ILFFYTLMKNGALSVPFFVPQTADGSDCSGLDLQFIPDDIPDSIKTLDFSFNYLPTLYNSTFPRLRSLVSLDLTRCSINFIYEDVFQYQFDLEALYLVANPLNFISDRAFSGPLALKYLGLAESMIRNLKEIPIAHLEFLETLDLRGSDIQNLDGLENLPLQQMKRLLLGMNGIEKINTADMEKLQRTSRLEISFKGNNLVDVEAKAFRNLDVNILDLSGCVNKMDMSVVLKGLEGVKTNKLYLGVYEDSSKSYITDLQSFCNISAVEVNFQLQHLPNLTNMSFSCFSKVQKLDFTRAHLSALPSSSSNTSMLSHLVLDDNSFTDMCHINAGNFPMLTSLSVSRNVKPLSFKGNCLEPLSHLKELQLSRSHINTGNFCCTKQLSGVTELKFLNLSYNLPMKWEALPFNATPNLLHLDLAHTKYVLNNSSPFTNLEHLQILNISFTNLTLLEHVHILKGLSQLRVLNLKGNTIQDGVLAKTNIFDYVPLLENLVLSSCGITEIGENVFKDLAHLKTVDLSENQLVKLGFVDFYSLNEIQLNFAGNKITLVDVRTVKDFGSSSRVDLSSNPLACKCTNYQFITWVKDNVSKMKHIEKTLCDATNEKIIDVDLQCVFSNGKLGLGLAIAAVIVILIALLYFGNRIHTRYRAYSRLQE
ncbi:hypothetical protein QTP70_018806, partial [Hemibagrus guttatus]